MADTKKIQVDISIPAYTKLKQRFNERKAESREERKIFYMSDMVEEIITDYLDSMSTK